MKLTVSMRITIICNAIFILVTSLFPPFMHIGYVSISENIHDRFGTEDNFSGELEEIGDFNGTIAFPDSQMTTERMFGFIFTPPRNTIIDVGYIVVLWAASLSVSALCIFLAFYRHNKPNFTPTQ